jgi:hypothetical protein
MIGVPQQAVNPTQETPAADSESDAQWLQCNRKCPAPKPRSAFTRSEKACDACLDYDKRCRKAMNDRKELMHPFLNQWQAQSVDPSATEEEQGDAAAAWSDIIHKGGFEEQEWRLQVHNRY